MVLFVAVQAGDGHASGVLTPQCCAHHADHYRLGQLQRYHSVKVQLRERDIVMHAYSQTTTSVHWQMQQDTSF